MSLSHKSTDDSLARSRGLGKSPNLALKSKAVARIEEVEECDDDDEDYEDTYKGAHQCIALAMQGYWVDVARDIAKRLKGSPLAANTVGRLLRKNLSREYWISVLEKNEWQNTKNDDDIMPSDRKSVV